MTADEFRTALARLQLGQQEAGRLFGCKHPRTVQRYALDERNVPPTLAILLQLLLDGTITIADVERGRRCTS